jgi:hypothetical protein
MEGGKRRGKTIDGLSLENGFSSKLIQIVENHRWENDLQLLRSITFLYLSMFNSTIFQSLSG